MVALAVLGLAVASGAPALAQRTGQAVEAGISDPTPDPGQRVTVTGTEWAPGTEVTIRFAGEPVGFTTVGHDGRFSRSVPIPDDAEAGDAEVAVEGTDAQGEPATFTIPVTVTGDGTPRGGYVWVAVVAGIVGAILLGGALLLLWRRRRVSVAQMERMSLDPVPDPDPRKTRPRDGVES